MLGSHYFFKINLFIYLLIYFWLQNLLLFIYYLLFIIIKIYYWVFVAAHGLSLVVVNRSHSSLWCAGFPLRWLACLCCGALALGPRALVVAARGLGCSVACGILPGQGSNPCPLHWQVDS